MNTGDLVRHMAAMSGKSYRTISKELGRSPGWLASLLFHDTDMRASTLCAIARACGYEIHATGPDDVTIDPTEGDQIRIVLTISKDATDKQRLDALEKALTDAPPAGA